ncbi:MAG: FHA domain-containing protein [Chthoniobacter sp.]
MIIPQTEVIATREGEEIFRGTFPPGEYIIGREVGMAIRLNSDKISRRHGQLSLSYFDWLIEDFDSANGTFVGGRPIKEAP